MSQLSSLSAPLHRRVVARCPSLSAVVFVLLSLCSTSALSMVNAASLRSEHLRDVADGNEAAQLHCLALNVYHEARGEPIEGKFAVAAVTLNRVTSRRFPNTVCRVVWQRSQFSWTNDGRPDKPFEAGAWNEALQIATMIYHYDHSSSDVGRATFFHTVNVRPRWAKHKRKVGRVGQHIFYESRGS